MCNGKVKQSHASAFANAMLTLTVAVRKAHFARGVGSLIVVVEQAEKSRVSFCCFNC